MYTYIYIRERKSRSLVGGGVVGIRLSQQRERESQRRARQLNYLDPEQNPREDESSMGI